MSQGNGGDCSPLSCGCSGPAWQCAQFLGRPLQGAHAHVARLLRLAWRLRVNFPYFYMVASVMLNIRLQVRIE